MHCHKHCPELLALTLEHGGDVNSSGHKGDTALHEAARKGDVAGVKWLLGRGADRLRKNEAGHVPLDLTRNKRVRELLGAGGR
jgi:ankyrin repeat protein